MCRSIRAENLSHFGFNTYDMLVQEFTKAPFDTFSEGDVHMLWYLYSSSDWTSWQVTGGFFSLFGISWKCAQIITSCFTFIRQGTFPLKRTWLYGVFVYMKIHASIKFNFAIFVVFKLQDNIPLFGYHTLFTHMSVWGSPSFSLTWIMSQWTILYKGLCFHKWKTWARCFPF